ncbi:magnesium transporter MRS2-3-like protein [Tanacetum coccineum]
MFAINMLKQSLMSGLLGSLFFDGVQRVRQSGSEENDDSKKGVVLVSQVEADIVSSRERATLEERIKAICILKEHQYITELVDEEHKKHSEYIPSKVKIAEHSLAGLADKATTREDVDGVSNAERRLPGLGQLYIFGVLGWPACVVRAMFLGLPACDLRILDPMLSYPSTMLGREWAIVINWEDIKAIITAYEVLLLNSADPFVVTFVEELQRRFMRYYHATAASQAGTSNSDDKDWTHLYDLGDHRHLKDRGVRLIQFEFVALEGWIEAALQFLRQRDEQDDVDEHVLQPEADDMFASSIDSIPPTSFFLFCSRS